MLHDLIANPRAAQLHHGAALKDAIRACADTALLSQVRDACHRGGLALLSVAAQRRISELSVGTCPVCNRADVEVSGGKLRSHLRRPGDTDGGACLGSGEAPTAAPVVEAFVEGEHATAARLGWTLEVIHDLGGRSEQQDRWSVAEVDGALLALVADGMGGHRGGAQAAETAARVFVETCRKHGATLSALRSALYAADAALAPHERRAPGTTLTALLLTSDRALLAHAGDSAALRWDGARWVEATIRHGQGRYLDLCVGSGGLESSEVTPQLEAVATGDVWLLCSDGLIPDVGKDGLWSSGNRRRMMPPDFAPGFLPAALEDARAAGSTDNATGILLYWTPVEAPTPEEEIARDLAAWTNSEPAEPEVPAGFSFDSAEGEPVKMTCTLCGTLVDARRWRIGRSMFALRPHDGAAGPCRRLGRRAPMESEAPSVFEALPAVMAAEQAADPLAEVVASVEAALPQSEPEPAPTNDLSPRQRALLDRLLDVQSISVEARAGLDEPRWADTGEPVEDDAPLLREAIQMEEAGKARSSYVDDFKRKLTLLESGRRLPKRGREAAIVEREPVNSEPLAGEEMPEVEDAERRPWIYTESIAVTGEMAPTAVLPVVSGAAPTGGALDEILAAIGCKVEDAIPKINALNRAASAWGALMDTLKQRNEWDQREAVEQILRPTDEDGILLTDYRDQIIAIEKHLNDIDPEHDARDEDHTTAEQVIDILNRVMTGAGKWWQLPAAMKVIEKAPKAAEVFLPLDEYAMSRTASVTTVSLRFELSQQDAATLCGIIATGGGRLRGNG